MKFPAGLGLCFLLTLTAGFCEPLLSVERIWSEGPHNAFTDLIRFQNRWVCAFREGLHHQGGLEGRGNMRILTSEDGQKWTSAALLHCETGDIRDAKLSITPSGELMLNSAVQLYEPGLVKHRSLAWFSRDARTWSEPIFLGDPNVWIWSVTWQDGIAYGIGYATVKPYFARLYRSPDGKNYEALVDDLKIDNPYPNESSLVFSNGEAFCLLRGSGPAQLGTARAPYDRWEWKKLGVPFGGPKLLRLPDGRFVAAGRSYNQEGQKGMAGRATVLCWVDFSKAKLTEFLRLPSAGDNSYPGLVYHDGILWVSYYSAHEEEVTDTYGKTSIYIARVRIPME